jgi:hypothetical protein
MLRRAFDAAKRLGQKASEAALSAFRRLVLAISAATSASCIANDAASLSRSTCAFSSSLLLSSRCATFNAFLSSRFLTTSLLPASSAAFLAASFLAASFLATSSFNSLFICRFSALASLEAIPYASKTAIA